MNVITKYNQKLQTRYRFPNQNQAIHKIRPLTKKKKQTKKMMTKPIFKNPKKM